ncbi:UvrB/UvrC motif-containing protein [Salimicrobium halophilum]|uniref:Protein-arginine kinase activator protein McsA n=1 Tax=Salimicrobium halophilum TaxID=86666 RepID=A0A1G8VZ20_9BACI|nr:UvrB/UvrC motif-containing protein [Salimicrobium halophilum]SDJ71341.1 Protein-arginine kinase activator protein McsA [Salimicrobium halophilum]
MQCQRCQQRPATVHLTQVVNGEKNEVHLCEQCAKEQGYMNYEEESFSLNDLLSGLFHMEGSNNSQVFKESKQAKSGLQCPTCGLTYQEFTRVGKFGCATCYETFDERLDPILRRVHSGNTRHHGKVPKRIGGDLGVRKDIEKHREKLHQLIQDEEFEEAANIRDEIKKLEEELNRGKGGES